MPYGWLADVVVVLHAAFVVFAVAGAFLVLKWPGLRWIHLPVVAWAVLIEFVGWVCPLTPLELWLRQQAGLAGYEGGFIEHYIWPLLYPAGLTRAHQYALGAFVLVVNVVIYAWAWRRRRARDAV